MDLCMLHRARRLALAIVMYSTDNCAATFSWPDVIEPGRIVKAAPPNDEPHGALLQGA